MCIYIHSIFWCGSVGAVSRWAAHSAAPQLYPHPLWCILTHGNNIRIYMYVCVCVCVCTCKLFIYSGAGAAEAISRRAAHFDDAAAQTEPRCLA